MWVSLAACSCLWDVANSWHFLPDVDSSGAWVVSPRPLCSLAGSSCLRRPHVASSSQATDLHPCRGISAELCYFCLEARQGLSLPGALLVWPHALRRAEFMLEEWRSEFSPESWGLRESQWGSSGQLSVVGAGDTEPGHSGSQQNRTKKNWIPGEGWGWSCTCPAGWISSRLMEWKEHWTGSQGAEAAPGLKGSWGSWRPTVELRQVANIY